MLSPESTVGEFLFTTVTTIAKREEEIWPRLIDPSDRDAIHDFRVEIRKLRAVLGGCASLIEKEWIGNLRSQLKVADEIISPLRNAHVLTDRFNAYPESIVSSNSALCVRLETMLSEAEETFQNKLNSQQFTAFLAIIDLTKGVSIPALNPDEHIYKHLKKFNKQQWNSLTRKILNTKNHQLHQIRIKAKKVRYLAEASLPVMGHHIEKEAKMAKQIQTLLGEFQDSAMMTQLATNPYLLEIEKGEIERIEITWEQLAHKVLN